MDDTLYVRNPDSVLPADTEMDTGEKDQGEKPMDIDPFNADPRPTGLADDLPDYGKNVVLLVLLFGIEITGMSPCLLNQLQQQCC